MGTSFSSTSNSKKVKPQRHNSVAGGSTSRSRSRRSRSRTLYAPHEYHRCAKECLGSDICRESYGNQKLNFYHQMVSNHKYQTPCPYWLHSKVCNGDGTNAYPQFDVVIHGGINSGKSSLIEQFAPNLESKLMAISWDPILFQHGMETKDLSLVRLKFAEMTTNADAGNNDLACIDQSNIILVCFSLTDHNSFIDAIRLMNQVISIKRRHMSKFGMVLIGTKSDLKKEREVSKSRIFEILQKYNVPYFETSVNGRMDFDELLNKCIFTYWVQSETSAFCNHNIHDMDSLHIDTYFA